MERDIEDAIANGDLSKLETIFAGGNLALGNGPASSPITAGRPRKGLSMFRQLRESAAGEDHSGSPPESRSPKLGTPPKLDLKFINSLVSKSPTEVPVSSPGPTPVTPNVSNVKNSTTTPISSSNNHRTGTPLNVSAPAFIPRSIDLKPLGTPSPASSKFNPDAKPFSPSGNSRASPVDQSPLNFNLSAKPFVPSNMSPLPLSMSPEPFNTTTTEEDAIAVLAEMFPTYTSDALLNVLSDCGDDLSLAVQHLLAPPVVPGDSLSGGAAYYPYYDQQQLQDQYTWVQGPDGEYYAVLVPPDPTVDIASEEQFPSLSGVSLRPQHTWANSASVWSAEESHIPEEEVPLEPTPILKSLRLRKLRDSFPWTTPSIVENALRNSNYSLESAHALLVVASLKPANWDEQQSLLKAKMDQSASSSTVASAVVRSSSPATIKWVSTGDSVATQYADLRKEARQCALARNQCFMNATKAFQTSNKALATELGRQGREWNVRMKELHAEAARQIFESRNKSGNVSADGKPVLDLHGLHVVEAIDFLVAFLEHMRSQGGGTFLVITGSGHHSADKKEKLRPAVEKYLQESDPPIRFLGLPDKRNYVGLLEVFVSKPVIMEAPSAFKKVGDALKASSVSGAREYR
mmetsp:Transcript_7303/g.11593  ORF Transcript_7303/g.11593 Transcript_7303/m.11593 type:complete len:633 (-) Transcript_7303:85-1983(-)|eukprot:CAMPEP_0184671188 /NCGR_PEP_ID=MMETSP0308-20130426/85347_1 /TAXON_ID=38269 /ORGANISM="Gloeochaete witrockiana, Strain SAG 46.84" /LENGTH=632 /DNA_ID=CAMNT_0027118271 /DNA_START=59 /DNA_END=1957 /DNA_ORIENTATION=+